MQLILLYYYCRVKYNSLAAQRLCILYKVQQHLYLIYSYMVEEKGTALMGIKPSQIVLHTLKKNLKLAVTKCSQAYTIIWYTIRESQYNMIFPDYQEGRA